MDTTIKVLALCDSPTCATGFAQVSRNVLKGVSDKYDITIIGINFDGKYYDREKYPYKIQPAYLPLKRANVYQDYFGRQVVLDELGTGKYDILWILQDTFIVEPLGTKIKETNDALPDDKKFSWIYYYPVDAPLEEKWVKNTIDLADIPVAYTEYGKKETQKFTSKEIEVIPHGVNTKEFYPLKNKKELKEKYFGKEHANKFIFTNVNRNQPRKDLFRTLLAYKKLLEKRKDVYLYLHSKVNDEGGNLVRIANQLRLVAGEDYAFPNPKIFTAAQGYPVNVLNEIYNASDCVISTTLGEGWGLSSVEAMATKTPIIFPDNTSLSEIIGKDRGVLVKTGEPIVLRLDNDRIRSIINTEDMVSKMDWIVDHDTSQMVDNAYNWVKGMDWNGRIRDQWIKIFDRAWQLTLQKRKEAKMIKQINWKKLSRNSICPICGIKIKKCRHANLI